MQTKDICAKDVGVGEVFYRNGKKFTRLKSAQTDFSYREPYIYCYDNNNNELFSISKTQLVQVELPLVTSKSVKLGIRFKADSKKGQIFIRVKVDNSNNLYGLTDNKVVRITDDKVYVMD